MTFTTQLVVDDQLVNLLYMAPVSWSGLEEKLIIN